MEPFNFEVSREALQKYKNNSKINDYDSTSLNIVINNFYNSENPKLLNAIDREIHKNCNLFQNIHQSPNRELNQKKSLYDFLGSFKKETNKSN